MAFSPKQNAKVNGNILIHLPHHKNSQEDMNNVSNIYGLGAGQTQETALGGGGVQDPWFCFHCRCGVNRQWGCTDKKTMNRQPCKSKLPGEV